MLNSLASTVFDQPFGQSCRLPAMFICELFVIDYFQHENGLATINRDVDKQNKKRLMRSERRRHHWFQNSFLTRSRTLLRVEHRGMQCCDGTPAELKAVTEPEQTIEKDEETLDYRSIDRWNKVNLLISRDCPLQKLNISVI